jgi:hypothetical protein
VGEGPPFQFLINKMDWVGGTNL